MTLPMSRPVRFRLLEDGRWSGGGSVLLENAREARERHPVLQGDSDAVPIMARNVPPMGKIPSQPFVLAPQNAWVWTPVATGLKERALVTGLRAGTWAMYRRAGAFIRISEAVPPGTTGPTSKVLHNVLDRGFETASAQHDDDIGRLCDGAFVCIGSSYAFRDLALLVRAHTAYQVGAGDSVVRRPESTRAQCLSALRVAHAAICPARVEASPVGVLEAGALAPRVLLSDIVGHRGVVGSMGGLGAPSYFTAHDEVALAAGLRALDDSGPHSWRPAVHTVPERRRAREAWGTALAEFLDDLARSSDFTGRETDREEGIS